MLIGLVTLTEPNSRKKARPFLVTMKVHRLVGRELLNFMVAYRCDGCTAARQPARRLIPGELVEMGCEQNILGDHAPLAMGSCLHSEGRLPQSRRSDTPGVAWQGPLRASVAHR